MILPKRFWDKVQKPLLASSCWIWIGSLSTFRTISYGQIWWNGRKVLAHRLSYEAHVGKILKDLTIDHICNNGLCVNPDHLRMLPMRDNILRGTGPTAVHARKVSCIRGHVFNKENTKQRKDGYRQCRICVNDSNRKKKEKLSHG